MRAIEGEETVMFGTWQWERGRKQPARNKMHAAGKEGPLHQFHTSTGFKMRTEREKPHLVASYYHQPVQAFVLPLQRW